MNKIRVGVFIQFLLIGLSMLLSVHDCYADHQDCYHDQGRRGKYKLSFRIGFNEPRSVEKQAKQFKISDRLCRHYRVHAMPINHTNEGGGYVGSFRTIELIRVYSYVCRIKITDLLNPNFKVYGLKVKINKRYR